MTVIELIRELEKYPSVYPIKEKDVQVGQVGGSVTLFYKPPSVPPPLYEREKNGYDGRKAASK